MANKRSCDSCGNRGGFLQEPKNKIIGGIDIYLKDILIHTPSNNEYQIKEIQTNGIVAKMTKSILPQVIGKLAYISNTNIGEYKRKKK